MLELAILYMCCSIVFVLRSKRVRESETRLERVEPV